MAVESVLLFGSGPSVRTLPVRFGRPERSSMNVMRVPLELAVPLAGLTLVPVEGGFATDLELRIAAMDDRGGRSEIPVIPVRLKVAELPTPGKFARYETVVELRRVTNQRGRRGVRSDQRNDLLGQRRDQALTRGGDA